MLIRYIKELKKELHYKDIRSVVRWCKNNNVGIFSDMGSKSKYVFVEEFENVRIKVATYYFKQKYSSKKETMNNENYKPSGYHEKTFLTSLLNERPEL